MVIQQWVQLRAYNTFGISALAKEFAVFDNAALLAEILANYKGKMMVLGGGSNVLFTKDYAGLILKNEIKNIALVNETEAYIYLRAGAGVSWHSFVMYCVQNNYGGCENLALIPGTVGACPIQNIGAYGVEVKDIIQQVEAYHIADKKVVTFTHADCEFGYRESIFKNKHANEFIILTVTFRLLKSPVFNISYGAIATELAKMEVTNLSVKAIADAVMAIRRSKLPDPALIGNAGSFFKNPTVPTEVFDELTKNHPGIVGYPILNGQVKLAAGWLIEQCGWKGYRLNDAGCHSLQALVLVNYGNAKGTDILSLSKQIGESVKIKFGVTILPEINIL